MNSAYLDNATIDNIYKRFYAEGSIQLHNFLRDDVAKAVRTALKHAEEETAHGKGAIPQ